MAKNINIYQIDAFTTQAFSGNPAGVTFSNILNDNEKQLIAREMNLSETAFLSSSEVADYKLQWFTPANEVNLCGHATIASLHYLYENNLITENSQITFETRSGIIKCFVKAQKYFMQIPIMQLEYFDHHLEEILKILGIEKSDFNDKHFIRLNNGYLYIKINSIKLLHSLCPDFKGLKKFAKEKNLFTDVAVFTTETLEDTSVAHLRFFAPLDGIDEDPVTGSACGPLLLVLLKMGLLSNYEDDELIIIEQGDVINRKGRVSVRYNSNSNKLFIAGNATTILKGNLIF